MSVRAWRYILRAAVALLLVAPAMGATAPHPPERVATGLQFPEGTIFVGDTLYFVDYGTSSVLRLTNGQVSTVWHQDGCGANGLVQVPEGLWVACFSASTIELISLDGKSIQTIRTDARGSRLQSPNDLTSDGKGGLWITASGSDTTPGKVFHMTASHRLSQVADGIRFANGVATSPDGRLLYVVESPTGRVWQFPINADYTLGTRREFVNLRTTLPAHAPTVYTPDSMRVDRSGNLLVALYDGGGVAIFRPDASVLANIDVPLAHHTNLAVSPDGRSLYVTAVDDLPAGGYRGELYRVPNPGQDNPATP